MAGKYNCAAALIREEYSKAHCCHCASHVLNLCIVRASKVPSVTQMWVDMTELSLFFDASPKLYEALLTAIVKQVPASSEMTLVSLCKTRWVARHDSLSTFEDLHQSVNEWLRAISQNETGNWSTKCNSTGNGLLNCIKSFNFLFAFTVVKKALSRVKSFTVNLQK